jgi:hypothetical protein
VCKLNFNSVRRQPQISPDTQLSVIALEYEVTTIGVASFDGKGNARSTFNTLDVLDNSFHVHEGPFAPAIPAPFGFSGSEGECHFTYTVKPDRTFTMQQSQCSGTLKIGTPTPVPLYTGPVPEIQGFMAQGRQTLVTTIIKPAEQTIIVGSETYTRVCAETTHYYRVWPSSGTNPNGQLPEEADNLDPRPWW